MDTGLQLKNEAAGLTYRLDQVSMILGRTSPGYPVDPGFVHVDHDTVSRRHAQLQWVEGAYQLTNLSTTNPIRINGVEVERCLLKAGDQLQLGECLLQLVSTRVQIQPRPPLSLILGSRKVSVYGFTVALGGSGGAKESWYDQEIELAAALPPQCLCLAWKEISGRYELSYHGAGRPPVQIIRRKGELEWLALLPADRPGGLRPGDRVRVGEVEFELTGDC
ncbi:FHA domain-containing protein [bacterium]|nr:FHA domain-containing protein [bacterium]